MSLIFATQLTAVATAVLAVFAIITATFAICAFRKQSREVGILIEQNDREIRDRRRAQASRVFIWTGPESNTRNQTVTGLITHIRNTSTQPVYDGHIRFRDGSGQLTDLPYVFLHLMPGDQVDTSNGFTEPVPVPVWSQDDSWLQANVRFRDAAGLHWQLGTDGQLDEIPPPEDGRPPFT